MAGRSSYLRQPAGRTTNSTRTTPNQDKRIMREMLREMNKATLEAMDKMTKAIVDKIDSNKKDTEEVTTTDATAAAAGTTGENMLKQMTLAQEIDMITDQSINNQVKEKRALKLKEDQRKLLLASRNWTEELEAQVHNQQSSHQEPKSIRAAHETIRETEADPMETTKKNVIRVLTSNIASLEARINQLENKEINNEQKLKEITERLNITMNICKTNHQQDKQVTNERQTPNENFPANRNKTPIIPTKPQTNEITDEGFIMVNNKKRSYKPTIGVSPGEGPLADPQIVPPLHYAKVLMGYKPNPKPVQFPPQILQSPTTQNDTETENETDNDIEAEMDDDQIDEYRDKIEESKLSIGFKPITEKMIDREEAIIAETANEKVKRNKKTMREIATKNAVERFMKDQMKISQEDRNQIQIK